MKLPLSIIVFFFIFSSAHAQLEKVKELTLSNISTLSVDRLGNFYFVLPTGIIQKYDPDGRLIDESLISALPLTLLEPWNPLKVFSYSNKNSQYRYWDHHLELLDEKILEPSLSISPHLVCPANENNKAWILDVADYSLKRVDMITNKIDLEESLPADWIDKNTHFVFIREYQNRVFLLDESKGIFMLNNLGKPITTIGVKGLTFFNFLGQELCYGDGLKIMLLDLFTGESRIFATLPTTENIVGTIITDERLVVVTGANVQFYKFNN